jgi:hypothetical protein
MQAGTSRRLEFSSVLSFSDIEPSSSRVHGYHEGSGDVFPIAIEVLFFLFFSSESNLTYVGKKMTIV